MILKKICSYLLFSISFAIGLFSINTTFASNTNSIETEKQNYEDTLEIIKFNQQIFEDDQKWSKFTDKFEDTLHYIGISIALIFIYCFPVLIGLYFYNPSKNKIFNINIKSLIMIILSFSILYLTVRFNPSLAYWEYISNGFLITVFSMFNTEISSNLNLITHLVSYPYFSSILKFILVILLPYLLYIMSIIFICNHLKKRKVISPFGTILWYTFIPGIIIVIILGIFMN